MGNDEFITSSVENGIARILAIESSEKKNAIQRQSCVLRIEHVLFKPK